MGILDTILAPFGASGAQVTQNVTAQQPTTVSGQTYTSAPQAAQPATVSQPISVESLVSGATSFVSPAISTIQPIISQAIPAVVQAAPALVPPVAVAAGVASFFQPQQLPVSKYQAADYGSPQIVQQPTFVSQPLTQYDVKALQAVQERPGYTPVTELGGLSTQRTMGAYKMFQENVALMGGTVAPSEMQVGRVLEAQRVAAPTTRTQQFYSGELSKWAENMVELGSAYHAVGATATVPIPANRYEYQADLAVEFLKGAPTKSSEVFSPVSGEMGAVLPGGKGLQESAWQVAKTGEVSKVSYSPAVEKLISAQGVYGPYGKLWGGPEYKETGFNAPQYRASVVTTEDRFLASGVEVTQTLQKPFTSANLGGYTSPPVSEYAGFSGLSGGLLGYAIWGKQSPNVMKGLIAASISDATAGLVNLSKFVPGSGQGKPYGEFSSWSTSAGEVVMERRGFTREQLETYGYGLESKPVQTLGDVSERLSYGFVKTMATNPGAIASGAGAGVIWAVGGEALGGVAGAVAAGGGRLAPLATRAIAIGESPIGTILPLAAFGGVTVYSATEGFTASTSKTLVNIGADIPGLSAMGLGAVGTKAVLQTGALGFQTKKTEYVKGFEPRVIDLTTAIPVSIPTKTFTLESRAEPFTIIGGTRYQYSDLLAEVSKPREYQQLPSHMLPGVRPLLTGEELGSSSFETGMGFMHIEKTQSTTSFILGGRGLPLEAQPPSAKTTSETLVPFTMPKNIEVGGIRSIRIDNPLTGLSKYEFDIAPIPMDVLPGVGKTGGLRVMESDIYAQNLIESIVNPTPKGIGKSTERGLEFSGAPMSRQMLESVTTIGGVKGGGYTSIEESIGTSMLSARMKPVTTAAQSQMILPSATKQTFETGVTISPELFEKALTGVFESEKRAPTTPSKTIRAFDVGLGEFGPSRLSFEMSNLRQNKLSNVIETTNMFDFTVSKQYTHVYTKELTKYEYGPTRATFETYMSAQLPTTVSKTTQAQIQTPAQATANILTTGSVSSPLQANIPSILQANIPTVKQAPDTFRITTSIVTPSPATPGRPDMFAITPPWKGGEGLSKPPRPDTFAIIYPYKTPVPPGPTPPTSPTPSKPIPPVPPIPPLFGGMTTGGGSLGGGRKRSKNFLEVFRMGLDIAAYGGMRTPRSPLPKLKGIPGLIQKKQTSPSAFKRKRKRS